MIPTLLDVLCHRVPYFNKKGYLDKVPAETIAAFNKSTQTIHENLRPKLADIWKEWAAKNSDRLKAMAEAPAAHAADDDVIADEEIADALGK
jgi:hypothetical protein